MVGGARRPLGLNRFKAAQQEVALQLLAHPPGQVAAELARDLGGGAWFDRSLCASCLPAVIARSVRRGFLMNCVVVLPCCDPSEHVSLQE